jgi:predicted glutamine amidotransferase
MCGLVGIAGKNLDKNDSVMLYHLLHFDTLRGKDSTGLAAIKANGEVMVYKEIGPPAFLYMTHKDVFNHDLFPVFDKHILIGHNRHATQGAIDAESAHPFEMGDITGAHNGTVSLDSLKTFEGAKDYKIDSQIIFSHLNHTKDIQKVWDTANGPMALVWHNKDDGTVNFARNKDRPLFYAMNKLGTKMYWASEPWMLRISAMRAGFELEDVIQVDINKHYKFNYDKKLEVETTPLTPFVEPWRKFTYRETDYTPSPFVKPATKGSGHALGTYFHSEFFIDKWVSTVIGQTKVPYSGYFMGEQVSTKIPVKITVPMVTPEIHKIIELVEEEDEWEIWESEFSFMGWDKNLNDTIIITAYKDISVCGHKEKPEKKDLEVAEEKAEESDPSGPTKKEWEGIVKFGCAYCQCELPYEKRKEVHFLDSETPLCKEHALALYT